MDVAAEPGEHTWGPISASATAGGITVTPTARVHKITRDMGDSTKVTCTKPGVYTKSSSSKADHKFTVTATSDWVIEWEGAGQTGTIRLNGLVREAQIAIALPATLHPASSGHATGDHPHAAVRDRAGAASLGAAAGHRPPPVDHPLRRNRATR